MSGAILRVDQARDVSMLSHLSEEFRQVIERIQGELQDRSIDTLEPDTMAQVEAAEQAVDARALDLQHGMGDRTAWQAALSEYEAAWLEVIESLGERRN